MEKETCYICGKPEYHDRAGYGFQVKDCDKCGRPVCEDHSDADADCDQDGYFMTSWQCKGGCREEVAA